MTDLIDKPHAVTRVEHEAYRVLVHLADGLHVVVESLNDIYLDGATTPAPDPSALDTLIGSTILTITTSEHGTLQMTTDDKHTVIVPPDPDYEAWSLVSVTKGVLAVWVPGAGVALWR